MFTRENYILAGWSTVQEPNQTDEVYEAGELYTVPEESVVLYAIWLKEGAGLVEKPSITGGKIYEEFTDGINVMISCNSAFTTKMSVLNLQPNFYQNRTLTFSNNLIQGTTIMMIDLSKVDERTYYYYKVQDDVTNSILLESFIKMGGTENYKNSTTTDLINETYLFIVELPKENEVANSTQMKLIRYSTDSEIAQIEQTVSFTTTAQREFNLNIQSTGEEIKIGDNFGIVYEADNPTGNDFRYEGKKVTLVINGDDSQLIPADTKISDGTYTYSVNANGEIIIPLGEVTENKEVSLQLTSQTLVSTEQGCNLKIELWVTNDETKPFMGEKVAKIENISLAAVGLPAMKVQMEKRLYHIDKFDGNINMEYETRNIGEYNVTLEIQKKNENGQYITQNGILNSVNNSTENSNGVFTLDIGERGELQLKFGNDFVPEARTYRILLKVNNESETKLTIPYNFILIE